MSTAPGPTPDPATVGAWQAALADEHAAVYTWGVLGARVPATDETLATLVGETYVEHRDRRDELVGLVAASGATPVAADTAYVVPPGLQGPDAVRSAAVGAEQASAAAYAVLVGRTSGADRARAIGWLDASAVRLLAFRGTPEMFPGADEHADR